MNVHKLVSGATVLVTSPGHGFKFSDGSESGPQDRDVCDKLTCKRVSRKVGEVKGMALNETRMTLDEQQLAYLGELCTKADLVLVPFPVLQALREQGVRERFANAVAFNATSDTQRAAPSDKIVDIQNWSY